MKTIFKGMVLLLAGASFVACSKDVSFDENAQNEAAIEQMITNYDVAFVNHFGTIASNQDWGFGQAKGIGSLTRGAFAGNPANQAVDYGYIVPNNVTSEKNGKVANAAQSQFINGKGVDITALNKYKDVDFVNFWIQHFNTAQGSHTPMESVEVYDANEGWIKIPGFEKGKNNDVTYFDPNAMSKGTVLLTGMGGKAGDPNPGEAYGKLFRWKESGSNNYRYDYKFLEFHYEKGNQVYDFLVLGFHASGGDWWEFVIKPAERKDGVVEEGRIMCEDLGDTKDFDFNDVVFDAKRYKDGHFKVTLLAAGGMLPIFVDGVDVHEKLEGTMKNTGVGDDSGAYSFTIPASKGYKSILEIPVTVILEVSDTKDAEKYKKEYALGAPIGKIPQKICAPIGTDWPKEYTDINDAYSNFKTWVQQNNPRIWMTVEDEAKTYFILVD